MQHIERLVADLAAECDDSYLLVVEAADGLWQARLDVGGENTPLFDREGDRVLCSKWRASLPEALAELDALCA